MSSSAKVGDKEESTTPLITNENGVIASNQTISLTEALKQSTKLAVASVSSMLFHPMYSIVNNIVLGHYEN